jgi:hypothetical protein
LDKEICKEDLNLLQQQYAPLGSCGSVLLLYLEDSQNWASNYGLVLTIQNFGLQVCFFLNISPKSFFRFEGIAVAVRSISGRYNADTGRFSK